MRFGIEVAVAMLGSPAWRVGQWRAAWRQFAAKATALRRLLAAGYRADDIGFDHDVGGAPDHQQMFDIVTADQHQAAAAIDRRGIDHRKPR